MWCNILRIASSALLLRYLVLLSLIIVSNNSLSGQADNAYRTPDGYVDTLKFISWDQLNAQEGYAHYWVINSQPAPTELIAEAKKDGNVIATGSVYLPAHFRGFANIKVVPINNKLTATDNLFVQHRLSATILGSDSLSIIIKWNSLLPAKIKAPTPLPTKEAVPKIQFHPPPRIVRLPKFKKHNRSSNQFSKAYVPDLPKYTSAERGGLPSTHAPTPTPTPTPALEYPTYYDNNRLSSRATPPTNDAYLRYDYWDNIYSTKTTLPYDNSPRSIYTPNDNNWKMTDRVKTPDRWKYDLPVFYVDVPSFKNDRLAKEQHLTYSNWRYRAGGMVEVFLNLVNTDGNPVDVLVEARQNNLVIAAGKQTFSPKTDSRISINLYPLSTRFYLTDKLWLILFRAGKPIYVHSIVAPIEWNG